MKPPARVIVLDMLAPVKRDEFDPLIETSGTIDRLSERMKTAPGAFGPPYDWPGVARTVKSMANDAKDASNASSEAMPIFIAGRAPLPLFVLLGQAWNLSGQTTPNASLTVLNPRRGGSWERYEMGSRTLDRSGGFFDIVDVDNEEPLRRIHKTNARIAIFVSTVGAPAPVDAIDRWFKDRGESLGVTVAIRTSKPGDVSGENIAAIAEDLRRNLPFVAQHFPNTNKFALIVAGPVPLAFAAGGALNPNQYPDVWLGNYAAPDYEYAFALPFRREGRPVIPDIAESRESRRKVLDGIIDGIDELRNTLVAEDFPQWAGDESRANKWIRYLQDLTVSREPSGETFGLQILTRNLSLGKGLLEALRNKPEPAQKRFGQLLLLHELYHDGQGLRGTNHGDIGRAGVVLEQTDFVADAFALNVLVRWDVRTGGREATKGPGKRAAEWVQCAIMGMEVFDKLEQGSDRIEQLYERRLRRYLIWHLQMARAKTIRSGSLENVRNQVDALFEKRLTVELAPLQGALDVHFEKVVTEPRTNTEFFAALDRHLIREAKRKNFDPGSLVEAVRRYDHAVLETAMEYVLNEHRDVLAPWALDA